MKMDKRAHVQLGLASLLIGFFLIILLKANGVMGYQGTQQVTAVPSLVQMEQENQQLSSDNEKIKQQLANYVQAQNTSTLANQQIQEAKMNAGLIGVSGPGLRITIDNPKNLVVLQDNQRLFFIHEGEIRGIINALMNGGAEAVAVNGQRVTTNTEVFCTESYIQINGTQQLPPYVIEAIGKTDILLSSYKFYHWSELSDLEKQYGITRKLEALNKVVIPAGKLRDYHYAKPIMEKEKPKEQFTSLYHLLK